MALGITFTVTPVPGQAPPPPQTTLGNACMEVASTATLTATGVSGPVSWSVSNDAMLSYDSIPKDSKQPWVITGKGFGQTTFTVTAGEGQVARLALCVGSVIIVGADDNHWQVFPDGSINKVQNKELHPSIEILVNSNAVVADLTGLPPPSMPSRDDPPSEAVTCYVLNLASFTLDKPKKQR